MRNRVLHTRASVSIFTITSRHGNSVAMPITRPRSVEPMIIQGGFCFLPGCNGDFQPRLSTPDLVPCYSLLELTRHNFGMPFNFKGDLILLVASKRDSALCSKGTSASSSSPPVSSPPLPPAIAAVP